MQTLEQMVTDPVELYLGVLEGGKDLESKVANKITSHY